MLRTLAFFSLVTSASASRLFPDHFARTFDFPDSKKDRLPETFVPGPLSELHLAKHQVVRSQAAGKVIVSGFAQPRLLPDVAKLKKLVSIPAIQKQGLKPLPESIDIVPSTDYSGESCLDVTVVFPVDMQDEEITSPSVTQMLSWIRNTILAETTSDFWPYIFVKIDGKDACPL